jgi:carbamoyltransferase
MKIIDDVEYGYVASLLKDEKIVALYQGQSESGPRALGNRSMLYTPTTLNGKDRINTVKRREMYRPLAASVLLDHVTLWFDMIGIKQSPYMTFSFEAWPDKAKLIPSVVHVDGTCRIQTVTLEQNHHYYKLIEAFYSITGVPMLLNTSFNLAGEPLVETIDDAFRTFDTTDIDYLYLPESGILVTKENT